MNFGIKLIAPDIERSGDDIQIINFANFSHTSIGANFVQNIAAFLKIEGDFEAKKNGQIVCYFLANSKEDVSIAALRSKVDGHLLDVGNRFLYDPMSQYLIAIQVRASRKYALCTSDTKIDDAQFLAKVGDLLKLEGGTSRELQGFSCDISATESNDDLTYAVKLVELNCDEKGNFKISDPDPQPKQITPIGLLPGVHGSDIFIISNT